MHVPKQSKFLGVFTLLLLAMLFGCGLGALVGGDVGYAIAPNAWQNFAVSGMVLGAMVVVFVLCPREFTRLLNDQYAAEARILEAYKLAEKYQLRWADAAGFIQMFPPGRLVAELLWEGMRECKRQRARLSAMEANGASDAELQAARCTDDNLLLKLQAMVVSACQQGFESFVHPEIRAFSRLFPPEGDNKPTHR